MKQIGALSLCSDAHLVRKPFHIFRDALIAEERDPRPRSSKFVGTHNAKRRAMQLSGGEVTPLLPSAPW
ncbi:hypothetical protein FIB18_10260 [Brucella pecoris]|uniref:Uncharacterized protein n=1 Tax=Brucella pecoris TaxID=867683 RepID=A0A5C5CP28_9HYPH|nr:hypothetical protein FIB18_10260 [Brucella pecoris]